MIKQLLIAVSLIATISSVDARQSPYINGLEGGKVIDIGESGVSGVESSPMIWEQYPAEYEILENIINTRKRILSEKTQCVTDDFDSTTCPLESSTCSIEDNFEQGSAKKITKKIIKNKSCDAGFLLKNGKCYVDSNRNSIRDEFSTTKSVSSQVGVCVDHAASVKIFPDWTGALVVRATTGTHNCGGDGYYDLFRVPGVPSGASVLLESSAGCLGSVKVNSLNTAKNFSSSCTQGGAQSPTIYSKITYTYTTCPSGTKADGKWCYVNTKCHSPFFDNGKGKCEKEYSYYEYTCPSDKNIYNMSYFVKDKGVDCGGHCPSGEVNGCVCNSATPPVNNCIRRDYQCQSDPSTRCTKVPSQRTDCLPGHINNAGKCEREEKYCGNNIYDYDSDSCVSYEEYEKLCTNGGDYYDSENNSCVSAQVVCERGAYVERGNYCEDDSWIGCLDNSFIYNKSTKRCEKPDKSLCELDGFRYDSLKDECINQEAICDSGLTYNVLIQKCETVECGIMSTRKQDGKCKTSSQCEGVLTSTGKCIPDINPSSL